jgi:hypothetical protein
MRGKPMRLRGPAKQWIEVGKGALKWTRLLSRLFGANAVRLQASPEQGVLECGLVTLNPREDGYDALQQ